MKVLNIHTRTIDQPKDAVIKLIESLATRDDKIWPYEKWPAMRFKNGKKVGARGGHGPVRYYISEYEPSSKIVFQFIKPEGLNGSHTLEIDGVNNQTTIRHTIDADAKGFAKVLWTLGIRPLHDALIEDAFDKVENLTANQNKKTEWSLWVRFLRTLLK